MNFEDMGFEEALNPENWEEEQWLHYEKTPPFKARLKADGTLFLYGPA